MLQQSSCSLCNQHRCAAAHLLPQVTPTAPARQQHKHPVIEIVIEAAKSLLFTFLSTLMLSSKFRICPWENPQFLLPRNHLSSHPSLFHMHMAPSVCLNISEWACLLTPLLDTGMRKMSGFAYLCLKDKCMDYTSIHPSVCPSTIGCCSLTKTAFSQRFSLRKHTLA